MNQTQDPNGLCDFCGGELRPQETHLELRVEGQLLVLERLPALVCRQCGEAYFTPVVSRQIDQLLARRNELQPLRYESVPVFGPELVSA